MCSNCKAKLSVSWTHSLTESARPGEQLVSHCANEENKSRSLITCPGWDGSSTGRTLQSEDPTSSLPAWLPPHLCKPQDPIAEAPFPQRAELQQVPPRPSSNNSRRPWADPVFYQGRRSRTIWPCSCPQVGSPSRLRFRETLLLVLSLPHPWLWPPAHPLVLAFLRRDRGGVSGCHRSELATEARTNGTEHLELAGVFLRPPETPAMERKAPGSWLLAGSRVQAPTGTRACLEKW